MMTIVAQPFNIIKWQLKFNPVAQGLIDQTSVLARLGYKKLF